MGTKSGSFLWTRILFGILFFFTPLLLTPYNYELFEFNKMIFVYAMTVVITASVMYGFIRQRRVCIPTTPLDIPIFLFLLSQLISTVRSIDPHMSVWGYYGRFNGGLVSVISYVLLYYAFVIAFSEKRTDTISTKIHNLWQNIRPFSSQSAYPKFIAIPFFASTFFVSWYAIFQKFGIDEHLWVQDVRNRVFSTLGQPNWLAAYSAAAGITALALVSGIRSVRMAFIGTVLATSLLLTAVFYAISPVLYCGFVEGISGSQYCWTGSLYAWFLVVLIVGVGFYAARVVVRFPAAFAMSLTSLLYVVVLSTKSRSGFLAFWFSASFFILFLLIKYVTITKKKLWPLNLKSVSREIMPLLKKYIILILLLVLLTVIIEPPFSISRIINDSPTPSAPSPAAGTTDAPIVSFDTAITDSGDIRRIVWRGAWDAALSRPLFGYGVETFAWIYYRFKPIEHNLTSEWDFLYNKAHNEFLNYAATSGFIGLGTYVLVIASVCVWIVRKLQEETSLETILLLLALLGAYISLQISHFFGFSVVVSSLLFWLLPGAAFSLYPYTNRFEKKVPLTPLTERIFLGTLFLASTYLIFLTANTWLADYYFAKGTTAARNDLYQRAYSHLSHAHALNPNEPLYQSELSETLSVIAFALDEQHDATAAAAFAEEAVKFSNSSLAISPANVSFWKSRTRLFYNLSQVNPAYLDNALKSMETTQLLAPTDPKVAYNRAILLNSLGRNDEAIQVLEEAILMKPNYRDAAFALALFYEEEQNIEKRDEWLTYIIDRINPQDHEAREKLGK